MIRVELQRGQHATMRTEQIRLTPPRRLVHRFLECVRGRAVCCRCPRCPGYVIVPGMQALPLGVPADLGKSSEKPNRGAVVVYRGRSGQ